MAQRVKVLLVDDIDGGSADETVTFALDGVNYEIDLSDAHASEFRQVFARWIAAGRRPKARRGPRKQGASDTPLVRAWARAQGHNISDRGRIPAEIRQAYDAAH